MTPKCINFYSCGDSMQLKTWSNVPYFFAKELEKKGYNLNRINIEPSPFLNKWYNRISYLVFQRIFRKDACPIFSRSWIHRAIILGKIRKVTSRTDSEICLNLFLSYLFYNKYSSKPSVLWCDWSDAIVIQRIGRKVKKYEKKHLMHEASVIKNADAVFSMFPTCRNSMEKMYDREIIYLDRNVVNTFYQGDMDFSSIIETRKNSNSILFIGNQRYLPGLKRLIEAMIDVRRYASDYYIDVIGMDRSLMPSVPEWVKFHGYLDKGVASENEKYYELLFNAKVLVNPTVGWAGYSSVIEAMYYATPVVVSSFEDFVEEFGETISFGAYCRVDDDLSELIKKVIFSSDYVNIACMAHSVVKDYTWSRYVDEFLSKLKKMNLLHE